MEMMNALRTAIQEWVLPEFDKLRLENSEIRTTLQLTNKRLDDIQAQLVDQSRRIDETNKRIDETNKRIDKVHNDLIMRNDETNGRLNRLYEVIVRREEHQSVVVELERLTRRVQIIEERLAA